MSGVVTFSRLGSYGRLGNQLFQIAATLAYGNRTGKAAIFKEWFCEREQMRFSDYFEHSLKYGLVPLPHDMINCNEAGYTYSPILSLPGSVNLFGYFQSSKYFDNCPDLIRHYFTPKVEIAQFLHSEWKAELAEVACSVHVRRSDYLISPHIYPACTVDYYRNAVDYMKKFHKVTRFLVFGDDMGWARMALQGDEFTFVEGQKSIEDLFLQSFCDHNIIANSSFSWWSSWLNSNPDKVVIAPRRWILSENAKDVYLGNWVIM